MKAHELMKCYRKKRELTQKEVAEKIHVSHNTYSQYETGKRDISIDMYIVIAKVLDMDVSILFDTKEKQKAKKEQEQELKTYKYLVERDFLTGIYNRRSLIEKGEEYVSKTTQKNVSFFLMDLDDFKAYNDTYGHDNGDHLLKETANVLVEVAKNYGGIVGRLGGEEFALFVEGDEKTVQKIANEVLNKVKEIKLMKEVTISIGITKYQKNDPFIWEELFVQADKLLYQAKKAGKNQFISA